MIRVGFIINFHNQSWLGGINYYRNLIDSIQSRPERKIEPVIFTGEAKDIRYSQNFPGVEVVQSRFFDESSPEYFLRKLYRRGFSYDLFLERFLQNQRIDVLSHAEYIGKEARIPSIGWIPDFQHKYMPKFFTKNEIKERDRAFSLIFKLSTCVILSSFAARRDAEQFYSLYKSKIRVLRFVAGSINIAAATDMQLLEIKYGFQKPYFLLPNQFWAHKDHRTVIEALRILKSHGHNVLVLATGDIHDYRQAGYFESLINLAKEYDVLDSFKVLGVLPYSDLIGLMLHSVSLINPSLFEGWSTSVEESKSLGKRIILSDIPVHREQAPERGVFFQPQDAHGLSEAMYDLWQDNDSNADQDRMIEAQEALIKRKWEFAESYEDIVLGLI